jgi:hypothetical protein
MSDEAETIRIQEAYEALYDMATALIDDGADERYVIAAAVLLIGVLAGGDVMLINKAIAALETCRPGPY